MKEEKKGLKVRILKAETIHKWIRKGVNNAKKAIYDSEILLKCFQVGRCIPRTLMYQKTYLVHYERKSNCLNIIGEQGRLKHSPSVASICFSPVKYSNWSTYINVLCIPFIREKGTCLVLLLLSSVVSRNLGSLVLEQHTHNYLSF